MRILASAKASENNVTHQQCESAILEKIGDLEIIALYEDSVSENILKTNLLRMHTKKIWDKPLAILEVIF